ncbi:hypothetical protein BGZ61DRAFT_529297 [Ilyonectria robusta]|uniref:uncharacterized protein n=1 Tax=Ilyonectria robusta TaxID=1079257 RepID=UPI001E8D5B86|nr:uncharacterized protein BGZ61DRAFT_529297 [Ilyonectria robusta]KAH8734095.1 hypothetical protein BGZ61DRAFT_529297 [Ilyonectria robusta]
MPRSLSCILCGAGIDASTSAPAWNDWKRKFQAIYICRKEWNAARISGIGMRQNLQDLIPLDESNRTYDVSDSIVDQSWIAVELLEGYYGTLMPRQNTLEEHSWFLGFPLHTCCWDILSVNGRYESQAAIQALFDVCASQPVQSGALNWNHDYGGFFRYQVDIQNLFPGEEPELSDRRIQNSSYESDPAQIPELRRLASNGDNGLSNTHHDLGQKPKFYTPNPSDPFQLLPSDLLVEILVWLPSNDVVSLRLASREFANAELPNGFWRSRFWPGRELSHIFETEQWATAGRCKSLFTEIKVLRALPSMLNRERVWALASRINDLVQTRLEAQVCHGSPCSSILEPDAPYSGQPWRTAELQVRRSSFFSDDAFRKGSIAMYGRMMELECPISRIQVSSVRLSAKAYVSGLRITQENGDETQLGYHHPRQEVDATWDDTLKPPGPLVGFDAALDSRGVRGIRFLSAQAMSCWIGDHEALIQTKVTCENSNSDSTQFIQGIKGGFDALKLVYLSIRGPREGIEQPTTPRKEGCNRIIPNDGSMLWYPQLPDPRLLLPSVANRNTRIYPHFPNSLCLFGGTDGQFLPYLAGISVWVNDRSDLRCGYFSISAIVFHFSKPVDGTNSMLLGQIPQSRIEGTQRHKFTLDSMNGERINGVDATYAGYGNMIVAITFYTNYGRTIEIHPRSRTYLGTFLRNKTFSKQLRPKGGTIVGFYSVVAKARHLAPDAGHRMFDV